MHTSWGWLLATCTSVCVLVTPEPGVAAPVHDACSDIGSSVGLGISSYGAAEGWPETARATGVAWRFLYFYVFPSQAASLSEVASFIQLKGNIAKDLDAVLVVTFYDLLKRGQSGGIAARAGAANQEGDIVQQVLARADLMRSYFDGYIAVLKAAAATGTTTMVHVEPDSWGFMMWAMGVEGRSDTSSVSVKVVGSGHPDLAGQGFSDDAGGFGKALLYLRDKHAPAVRLGWHASNFRSGARPEVVTAFYSNMGEWDAIVTEEPHILRNADNWWEPLDSTAVDTNVNWVSTVSRAAGVPVLFWQLPIGPVDYHLLSEAGGRDVLNRFMAAGLGALMWEQTGTDGADPETFRAPGLAIPPSGSPAGGTAKDLRVRLASYQTNPLPWPNGSPCARGSTGSGGAPLAPSSDGGARDSGAGARSGGSGGSASAVGSGSGGSASVMGSGSGGSASAVGSGSGGSQTGFTDQDAASASKLAPTASGTSQGGCSCACGRTGSSLASSLLLGLLLLGRVVRRAADAPGHRWLHRILRRIQSSRPRTTGRG